MKNVTLHVQGMSCGHCVKSVEGSVGQLAGVDLVTVKLDAGQVDVTFDDSQVSLDTIKATIEDQGYGVE
ncbi:copper chaperone CopZ [Paenibacillus sp. FSL W7-1287]|uniref:copper chaperone CopZ n=1 Tax=Paenibacillus sp. FSL W7-1287 TaxID=2954538 RepID=UPI0030F819C9